MGAVLKGLSCSLFFSSRANLDGVTVVGRLIYPHPSERPMPPLPLLYHRHANKSSHVSSLIALDGTKTAHEEEGEKAIRCPAKKYHPLL